MLSNDVSFLISNRTFTDMMISSQVTVCRHTNKIFEYTFVNSQQCNALKAQNVTGNKITIRPNVRIISAYYTAK